MIRIALALSLAVALSGCATIPAAGWAAIAAGATATGVVLNADVALANDYLELRGYPPATVAPPSK